MKRPHRQDLCCRCKGLRLSCDATYSFKYIVWATLPCSKLLHADVDLMALRPMSHMWTAHLMSGNCSNLQTQRRFSCPPASQQQSLWVFVKTSQKRSVFVFLHWSWCSVKHESSFCKKKWCAWNKHIALQTRVDWLYTHLILVWLYVQWEANGSEPRLHTGF